VDETTMLGLKGRGDRAREASGEKVRVLPNPPSYYVMVGNHAVHGKKKIFTDDRLEYKGFVPEAGVEKTIFSRGFYPEQDVIWLVCRKDM
jgi:hypothetical protein